MANINNVQKYACTKLSFASPFVNLTYKSAGLSKNLGGLALEADFSGRFRRTLSQLL